MCFGPGALPGSGYSGTVGFASRAADPQRPEFYVIRRVPDRLQSQLMMRITEYDWRPMRIDSQKCRFEPKFGYGSNGPNCNFECNLCWFADACFCDFRGRILNANRVSRVHFSEVYFAFRFVKKCLRLPAELGRRERRLGRFC
jgi:hypothetical protein